MLGVEPFIPKVDYNNPDDVFILREKLDQRYQEISNQRKSSQKNNNIDHHRNKSVHDEKNSQNNVITVQVIKNRTTKLCHVQAKNEQKFDRELLDNQNHMHKLKNNIANSYLKKPTSLSPFIQTFLQDQLSMAANRTSLTKVSPKNKNDYIYDKISRMHDISGTNFEDVQIGKHIYTPASAGQNFEFQLSNREKKNRKKQKNREIISDLSYTKKQRFQMSLRDNHQRMKEGGLYLRDSPCYDADPENTCLQEFFQDQQQLNMVNINNNCNNTLKKSIKDGKRFTENVYDDFNSVFKQSFFHPENKDFKKISEKYPIKDVKHNKLNEKLLNEQQLTSVVYPNNTVKNESAQHKRVNQSADLSLIGHEISNQKQQPMYLTRCNRVKGVSDFLRSANVREQKNLDTPPKSSPIELRKFGKKVIQIQNNFLNIQNQNERFSSNKQDNTSFSLQQKFEPNSAENSRDIYGQNRKYKKFALQDINKKYWVNTFSDFQKKNNPYDINTSGDKL